MQFRPQYTSSAFKCDTSEITHIYSSPGAIRGAITRNPGKKCTALIKEVVIPQNMMQADTPPNQTIYINNLNENVKQELLKKDLSLVYLQFGKILEIVSRKSLKLRGQASVVFNEITAASTALRQMERFPFHGKAMRIQYAKSKSDAAAMADGTFVSREERKKQDEKKKRRRDQRPEHPISMPPQAGYGAAYGEPLQAVPAPQVPPRPVVQEAPAPSNSIVFIQNLPREATHLMVEMIQKLPGFKEVRTVENMPGIAFVEFGNKSQASLALEALQHHNVTPTKSMQISYAKK